MHNTLLFAQFSLGTHVACGTATPPRQRRSRTCSCSCGEADCDVCLSQRIIRNFELWRWAFFVGLLFPVWLCGSLLTFILIRIVEAQFLTTRNVLYFIAAVRVCEQARVLMQVVRFQF